MAPKDRPLGTYATGAKLPAFATAEGALFEARWHFFNALDELALYVYNSLRDEVAVLEADRRDEALVTWAKAYNLDVPWFVDVARETCVAINFFGADDWTGWALAMPVPGPPLPVLDDVRVETRAEDETEEALEARMRELVRERRSQSPRMPEGTPRALEARLDVTLRLSWFPEYESLEMLERRYRIELGRKGETGLNNRLARLRALAKEQGRELVAVTESAPAIERHARWTVMYQVYGWGYEKIADEVETVGSYQAIQKAVPAFARRIELLPHLRPHSKGGRRRGRRK